LPSDDKCAVMRKRQYQTYADHAPESAQLGFWVDVRTLNVRGRWKAVAFIGGDPDVGYGPTRLLALRRALAGLGAEATDELLREHGGGLST
jgi:hypothetical protein